jgi:hypothetical protein
MTPRTSTQRREDTLEALRQGTDVWVASANESGEAHLIPLSYSWDGHRLTVATPLDSVTVRNLTRTGRMRVSMPSTSDVVILEGPIDVIPIDADEALANAHATAAGFDPRQEPNTYVYLRLTPSFIQAWRNVAELKGRTIMRDGAWLES